MSIDAIGFSAKPSIDIIYTFLYVKSRLCDKNRRYIGNSYIKCYHLFAYQYFAFKN